MIRRRAAVALALAAVTAVGGNHAFASTAPAPAAAAPCAGWTVTPVASGLGSLENLLPTTAGIYLSATDRHAILLLHGNGDVTTVASGVNAPGGLAAVRGNLYFNTGDAAQSAATNTPDGTIQELTPTSPVPRLWAGGLVMPNGLGFLPDGSALVTRVLGGAHPTGITRVPAPGAPPVTNWSPLADTNGLVVSPDGRWVYTDETFTAASNVYRVPVAHPDRPQILATLADSPAGVPKGLDDMTLSTSGTLYVAANIAGQVICLNPRTGAHCVIATGLTNTSSVRQGSGGGFPSDSLYVSGFDGRVLRLAPPQGSRP